MKPETRLVPISQVTPNPWNPNVQSPEVYDAQLASIKRFGFAAPIVVRRLGPSRFEIIDGEHRYRAAMELGIENVPVYDLGDVGEVKARQLTEVFIHLKGMPDAKREAALLKELEEIGSADLGDVLADLAAVVPQSADTLRALVDAADFDWDAFAASTAEVAPTDSAPVATPPKPEDGEIQPISASQEAEPGAPAVALTITGLTLEQRDRILEALDDAGQESQALALLAIAEFYLGRE